MHHLLCEHARQRRYLFQDDGSGNVYPSANYVEPPVPRVLERRREVVGSGKSPTNTSNPAGHMVMSNACEAGQGNNFAEAFL